MHLAFTVFANYSLTMKLILVNQHLLHRWSGNLSTSNLRVPLIPEAGRLHKFWSSVLRSNKDLRTIVTKLAACETLCSRENTQLAYKCLIKEPTLAKERYRSACCDVTLATSVQDIVQLRPFRTTTRLGCTHSNRQDSHLRHHSPQSLSGEDPDFISRNADPS